MLPELGSVKHLLLPERQVKGQILATPYAPAGFLCTDRGSKNVRGVCGNLGSGKKVLLEGVHEGATDPYRDQQSRVKLSLWLQDEQPVTFSIP